MIENHITSERSKKKKIWSAYWLLRVIIIELYSGHIKSKSNFRKVE